MSGDPQKNQTHLQTQALLGLHIAITRPVAQADALSQAITRLGGQVLSFPLLATQALADYQFFDSQLTQLAQTHWAIFISSNAVHYAMPRILAHYPHLPAQLKWAAIGPQTAQALASFGIQSVRIPNAPFDSESLLKLSEMQSVQSNTIAIVRGVGGRELMAKTLSARGAHVYFLEAYQRTNPQSNADALAQAWQQGKLQAVVVTSSEAMRTLLNMALDSPWLNNVTLCVNHARIATLPLQHGLNVRIANTSGDEAMLALLTQLK